MTLTYRILGDTGLITVAGRFTFECHQAFKDAADPLLASPEVKAIHLDLSGVESMNASSLGMLLVLREKAVQKGKTVLLKDPAPCAVAILEAVQFTQLFLIAK